MTDGRTTVKRIDPSEDDLIPIQVHVWDIERFHRNRVSGDLVEDTDVIISDFGIQPFPVPHLMVPIAAMLLKHFYAYFLQIFLQTFINITPQGCLKEMSVRFCPFVQG